MGLNDSKSTEALRSSELNRENRSAEDIDSFSRRKRDHINQSLSPLSQSSLSTGQPGDWSSIDLGHEALPQCDFAEVDFDGVATASSRLGGLWWGKSPYFISSMTAGHTSGVSLNRIFAKAAQQKGWPMGVGSQRRELFDPEARGEWVKLREAAPKVELFANVGIAQLIGASEIQIRSLVESASAKALFIHLNPLQEVIQIEGTPLFRGGIQAIERTVKALGAPVVVKETGSGIGGSTARRLIEAGVAAIDVSGRGGTHWGRVEGLRGSRSEVAETYKDWGVPTSKALKECIEAVQSAGLEQDVEVWASGGIRNGLEAAKSVAIGAARVGLAQPLLRAAMAQSGDPDFDEEKAVESVVSLMDRLEYEFRVALFCSGTLSALPHEKEVRTYARLKGSYKWQPKAM